MEAVSTYSNNFLPTSGYGKGSNIGKGPRCLSQLHAVTLLWRFLSINIYLRATENTQAHETSWCICWGMSRAHLTLVPIPVTLPSVWMLPWQRQPKSPIHTDNIGGIHPQLPSKMGDLPPQEGRSEQFLRAKDLEDILGRVWVNPVRQTHRQNKATSRL